MDNSILYIQMSLYGENENTYKQVTGSKINYKKAMKGLNCLVRHHLDVTILTVATANNAHKVSEFYQIAKNSGAVEFRLTPEIYLGRSAGKLKQYNAESKGIWENLIKNLHDIKASMAKDDPPLLLDARPLLGAYLHKITGFATFFEKCSAATTMLYVGPTGDVLPCPFLRQMPPELGKLYGHIKSENIREKKFQEIWNSQSYELFRSYYNPQYNLFKINQNCRYFQEKTCIPCAVTPCNCIDMINLIRNEVRTEEPVFDQIEHIQLNHFKAC